jgi:hypothetical protein
MKEKIKYEIKYVGGCDRYYFLPPIVLPSGEEIVQERVSECPDPANLSAYIQNLIQEDIKKTSELKKLSEKKAAEEEARQAAKNKKQQEKEAERKRLASFFIAMAEGQVYGLKGSEMGDGMPFDPQDFNSKKDIVSSVQKRDGRIIVRCSSSGDNFGFSISVYSSSEEIDATDFFVITGVLR